MVRFYREFNSLQNDMKKYSFSFIQNYLIIKYPSDPEEKFHFFLFLE